MTAALPDPPTDAATRMERAGPVHGALFTDPKRDDDRPGNTATAP
jgi:hypothetical protein